VETAQHVTVPPGTGKTHLAVAIAYRAIQNGGDALFTSAAALIESLSIATRRGELAATLARYTHPSVLVIQEVGYLTVGGDAANLLFQVVNERYLHHRPCSSPPTNRSPRGGWCCTIPISRRHSSIASLNADAGGATWRVVSYPAPQACRTRPESPS
jgi:hypothetical protein